MPSLLLPVDIYCERLSPELWAEPLNALSNGAFILAALLAWPRAQDRAQRGLAGLIALIGLGSLFFHTYAVVLTGILDVAFTGLFIAVYLPFLLRRAFGLCGGGIFLGYGLLAGLILASNAVLSWLSLPIPGLYMGCFTLLLLLGGMLAYRRHSSARYLLSAAALFAVSLTFRTLDTPLCDAVPMGTHYAWHVINAAVLYLLVRGLPAYSPDTCKGLHPPKKRVE